MMTYKVQLSGMPARTCERGAEKKGILNFLKRTRNGISLESGPAAATRFGD